MNWVQSKFTDFTVPPSKKLKSEIDSQNHITTKGKPLYIERTPRWKPRSRNDLVVNKKKIEEVGTWLLKCKRKETAPFLLLTGPPGSGKLTTLKVSCAELQINLVEWLPQVAQREYKPEEGEFYQSALSLFEEFVSRATRYSNVLNSMSSRLIVVKEIPNSYMRDPGAFHEFLCRYSRVPDVFVAFILTDVPAARSLFPDNIKSALNVATISFNPVIQRGVKDVLKKMYPSIWIGYTDDISVSCNGDLRKAITTMEFVSKNGSMPVPKKGKSKKSKSDVKSDFLDLFHGLGRILYSKRENGKLVHNPIEIGDSFTSSPDLFLGMLHENYLHTFSSVHDIAKANDVLSSSEVLLNDFNDTYSSSRLLSLALASCGLMTYNSAPFKKFQQLNKPTKVTNILTEFRSRFSDTNVLLDVATYGRAIPSYAQENYEMLSRISELK